MQKTSIHADALQPMFEAVQNAAKKGQSQFFTPLPFGQRLAEALPRDRPVLVDLTCGAGHLLHASARPSTQSLLGADVDACRGKTVEGARLPLSRITCELTQLYPLLHEVAFAADAFVLNPPWRLYLYRERLAGLADSELPAVRLAYKATEAGIPAGTIDSTIATLLIALDRCTRYGEGFLIGNNATLGRLIFEPDAPHAAIAKHIWARLAVPGNPMTGISDCQWKEGEQFETGVIYFARDHTTGPKTFAWPDIPDRCYRQGAELRNTYVANLNCHELWSAVREKAGEIQGLKQKTPWNLWLAGGTIRTDLSPFERHSRKVDKKEAERLFKLQGKTPMELVLQRASRDELQHIAEKAGWRVQAELLTAVRHAIQAYHAERSPLYPLPEIQRLGYLDEEDTIECKASLADGDGAVVFRKGTRYTLRTQTVAVTRKVRRPNSFTGRLEDIEYSGNELAFFISTESEAEWCFMDAKLINDAQTTIANGKKVKGNPKDKPADFTLEQLCGHFVIPDVPDVATVNPDGYNQMLELLTTLELITEEHG